MIRRLLLALLAPLLFLAAVELVLRVGQVGWPTTFLRPLVIEGKRMWVDNDAFGLRFFPPAAVRLPRTILAPREKGDAFRVVVLGESAALGDPMPEVAASRMLEVILNQAGSDRRVEVVNAAMTAVNSHVIREIARDIRKLKPDVVIILMGNNEVLGPYGPGTFDGGSSRPDWRIHGHRVASRFRVHQLIQRTVAAGFGSSQDGPGEWTGLQAFSRVEMGPDDPRLDDVIRRFRENVESMLTTLTDADTEVLLCTIPVNVGDWPPFASQWQGDPEEREASKSTWIPAEAGTTNGGLLDDDGVCSNAFRRSTVQQFGEEREARRDAALRDLARGNLDAAIVQLRQLAEDEPGHGETAYHLGQALAVRGEWSAAMSALRQALQADRLRFRAETRLQEVVRQLAESHRDRGVQGLDLSRQWQELGNPVGADRERFIDHVHYTWSGNRVLAEAWTKAILPMLGLDPASVPAVGDDDLALALVWTMEAERELIHRMKERFAQPPFDRVFGMEARLRGLDRWRESLEDVPMARRELELEWMARDTLPTDPDHALRLAALHEKAGRTDEVRRHLEHAVRLAPHALDVAGEAALWHFKNGNADAGFRVIEACRSVNPAIRGALWVRLTEACLQAGVHGSSRQLANRALEDRYLTPSRAGRLCEGFLQRGWYDDAVRIGRRMAARFPQDAGSQMYWAKAALAAGAREEAEKALDAALKIDEHHAEIFYYQAVLQFGRGEVEAAVLAMEEALARDPGHRDALAQWAILLSRHVEPAWLDQRYGDPADLILSDLMQTAAARQMIQDGQWDRARHWLEMRYTPDSRTPESLGLLAWTLAGSARDDTDLDRAVDLAGEAVRRGHPPQWLDQLADFLASQGARTHAATVRLLQEAE